MALEENEGRRIYLNIKEGRIHYKDPKTGTKKDTGTVSGIITAGVVNQKEWQGKKYEELALTIIDGDEKYLLQINVNSGYFRAFCNQMKNGDPTVRVKLAPSYKEEDGKKNSSMFVEQNGELLPWYSTSEDRKDVPAPKPVTVNGETLMDRSEHNAYWKNWLASVKWGSEFEASANHYPAKPQNSAAAENNSVTFDDDSTQDLPF